jgi:hypothetical protein
LNWITPPTSSAIANSIVKRDSSGGFSAGGISGQSANGSTVVGSNTSSGIGVYGTSVSGTAVYGLSGGTSGPANGVQGVTSSVSGSGVAGVNNSSGIGVYGFSVSGDGVYGQTGNVNAHGVAGVNTATGGIGVLGSAPNGDGFYTVNNVYQGRTAGGWIKAMAFVSPTGIVTCFNSTLIGAAATVPPCGFAFDKPGAGDYIIDFGFQVDDRFFSITGTGTIAPVVSSVCTDTIGVPCANALTPNQVEISCLHVTSLQYIDAKVYLVVY